LRTAYDSFGCGVALSGDRALIGAADHAVGGRGHTLAHRGFDLMVILQARIEIDEYAGERRMKIEDAAHAFETAREAHHFTVRFERDFIAERDKQRAVAGGP